MINIPTKKLNSKASIPILGLGTAALTNSQLQNAIKWAFDAGYRHIDTADYYNNQKEIGNILKTYDLKRDLLFITTKVWKSDLEPERVKSVLERSLDELQTDYVDLYLIHAPSDKVPISETLCAMQELQKNGLINSIGISNFNKIQTKQVLSVQNNWKTDFKVVNNQIEYNPNTKPDNLVRYCFDNNVSVTAYSPLDSGAGLDRHKIKQLADKYDKTPAQIILKWEVQKGLITIPKSADKTHIEQNANIFDWEMSSNDMKEIDNI